jgi:hypothetical protein
MRSLWFWTLAILGSGASLGLFWASDLPLGVPGEWTWSRHDVPLDLFANALWGLVSGAAYLTFVGWGYRRLDRPECSVRESSAWLIGLAAMAGVWTWTVLGEGATGATVARWPFVLYYPSSSGYFVKARYEVPDSRQLLRDYESLMREGDVLHVGTHPPGLFLFFHGLSALVDSCPALVSVLNDWQPQTVREAFDVIRDNSIRSAPTGRLPAAPLTAADRAIVWLASLICFAMSAVTVWPIYGFLRQHVDRSVGWVGAAVWPLVPAAAIFLPKSDVAFAFFSMTLAWLWQLAWRRRSPWWSASTGALWSLGLLCSLAFLPVAVWLALLSLFESWPALRAGRGGDEFWRAAKTVLPAGIVCLTVLLGLSLSGDVPLWKIFWLNYQNHAGFYLHYPRTYLAWLAENPLEFACAVGFPLMIAGGYGTVTTLRRRADGGSSSLKPACLATLCVWSWLWLSGKNSGETARLWIFLMPYLAVCSAAAWTRPTATASPRREPWSLLCWLGCQAIVCFATVQRINGFPLQ